MATITKRGESYLIRWYGQDGQRRGHTCPTKQVAKDLVREVEHDAGLGRDWTPRSTGAESRPRIEDVAGAYLTARARKLRAATISAASYALGYFVEWLGTTERPDDLRSLTASTLDAYYSSMPTLAEGTRQNRIRTVIMLWRWAYDSDDYAELTPRPRAFELPTLEKTPTIAPTWEECDAVIAALRLYDYGGPPRVVSVRFAILLRYTGLRAGQVIRLTWEDFDLDARTLRIRGALGKSRQERGGRVVPIAPALAEEMAGWGVREGGLFREHRIANLAKTIRPAWKRLAAQSPPVVRAAAFVGQTDHAFRKAFVTELRRAGAETDAVEYLVGHSSGIRAHYLDADALPLREAVALVRPIGDRIKVGSNVVTPFAKRPESQRKSAIDAG